jgi:endonuclease III
MDRQKLITRRMVNSFPLIIAKKNYYKEKDYSTFDGFAVNPNGHKNKDDLIIAKKSEKLLKINPFAFIVGCHFDRGRRTWQAWRAPYLIAQSEDVGIKNMKPIFFVRMRESKLARILKENDLGSRLLSHERAANYLKLLALHIHNKYGGQTKKIWEKAKNFKDLIKRIDDLPGFGVGLTNMTVKILIELGMIPQIPKTNNAKKDLQVKADIHVQRVFYRTGLAKLENEKAAMAAAKRHMPSFPMSLDNGGYQVGMYYCYKSDPSCNECPLYKKSNNKTLCRRRGI